MAGDFLARSTFPFWDIDRYALHRNDMVWTTATRFLNRQERPDIVFLGSSLVINAVNAADALYLNTVQDSWQHHHFALFEKLLGNKQGNEANTFVFATSGQFVSDAYALTRALFTGDLKPRCIIYGIGPRDFMDNLLSSPASTEPFRTASQLTNLTDVIPQACYQVSEAAELVSSQLCFTYAHRHELAALAGLESKPADLSDARTRAVFDPRYVCAPYEDNLMQYRMRYQPFRPRTFLTQVGFLKSLMQLCRAQGIELVLVRMPLTQDNMAIMPRDFYSLFVQNVDTLAKQNGCTVIDLNDSREFPKTLFADSVHLNGNGATLFARTLAERMRSNSHLAATLSRQL